jgi:hypothetical protein
MTGTQSKARSSTTVPTLAAFADTGTWALTTQRLVVDPPSSVAVDAYTTGAISKTLRTRARRRARGPA